jgi:hypothetical protein
LFKIVEVRYKSGVPPGYRDSEKDSEDQPHFVHNGITYEKKYGDYLVWIQTIKHAKQNGVRSLILVTDDNKEDWWLRINSDGEKTIGPRPELVEEIAREGGVQNFLLYSSESFLSHAKTRLEADVSEETIKDVREVATDRDSVRFRGVDIIRSQRAAEKSVFNWLSNNYRSVNLNEVGFPDILASDGNDRTYGFEVKYVRDPRVAIHRLRENLHRLYYSVKEGLFDEGSLVLVASEPSFIEEIERFCIKFFRDRMPSAISLIIGTISAPELTGDNWFIPSKVLRFDDQTQIGQDK